MFDFQKKELVKLFPEEIVEKLQSYNKEHWDSEKAEKLLSYMSLEDLTKKFNDQAITMGKFEDHSELLSNPNVILALAPFASLSRTNYPELSMGFIMALFRYAFRGELDKPLTVVDYYRVKSFLVAVKNVFSIRKSYSDDVTDYYVCNFISIPDMTELEIAYKEYLMTFFSYGEDYQKTKEYWDIVKEGVSSIYSIDIVKKYSETIAKGDNLNTLAFIMASLFLYTFTLNKMLDNKKGESDSSLLSKANKQVFFTSEGQYAVIRIMEEFEKEFKS